MVLAPALALAACAGLPNDPKDCTDADCRRHWVDQRWQGDGAAGAQALSAVTDPVERIALITAMLDKHPEAGKALCDGVLDDDPLSLCNRRRGRGHLWQTPAPIHSGARRLAPGPATSPLRAPEALVSRLAGTAATEDSCEVADRDACRLTEGIARGRAGDAAGAAAVCAGIGSSRWRNECAFRAAESLVGTGPAAYAQAVELCLLAADFAANCQGHLLRSMARGTPPATHVDRAAWGPVFDAASAIAATWEARDPSRRDEVASWFWSEVLLLAYTQAEVVTGDPLDVVPAAAVPHVRAAAAMRLAQLNWSRGWRLDQWVDQLAASLKRRTAAAMGVAAAIDGGDVRPRGATDWWPSDQPGDENIPAIIYLSTTRRAVSDDEAVDERICMLEALARMPDAGSVVVGTLQDPDPLVEWTARRLAEARLGAGPTADVPGRPLEGGARRSP